MPRGEKRAGGRPPLKGKGNSMAGRVDVRVPPEGAEWLTQAVYDLRDGKAALYAVDEYDPHVAAYLREQAAWLDGQMAAGEHPLGVYGLAVRDGLLGLASAIERALAIQQTDTN